MAKARFVLYKRAIAALLHNGEGGQKAVDEAAQQVVDEADDPEVFLSEPYHTDRYVRAVMVPADKQAKHGIGTRAANSVASRRK